MVRASGCFKYLIDLGVRRVRKCVPGHSHAPETRGEAEEFVVGQPGSLFPFGHYGRQSADEKRGRYYLQRLRGHRIPPDHACVGPVRVAVQAVLHDQLSQSAAQRALAWLEVPVTEVPGECLGIVRERVSSDLCQEPVDRSPARNGALRQHRVYGHCYMRPGEFRRRVERVRGSHERRVCANVPVVSEPLQLFVFPAVDELEFLKSVLEQISFHAE